MGQYHLIVNVEKREYINAHKLGSGLKALEQIAGCSGTPQALFILLMASNGRGGGDLKPCESKTPVIGRWAGDRIAVIGDYAKGGDIQRPLHDPASQIFEQCMSGLYEDVSDLVRPVLESELGVRFNCEAFDYKKPDGSIDTYKSWYVADNKSGTSS